MAVVINGSRIADNLRVALAGIDVNHTLGSKCVDLIIAQGQIVQCGTSWRCQPHEWFWRQTGGTFASIASTGEIKFVDAAGDTVLSNTTIVSCANRRANAGGCFVASGVEFENGANPLCNVCRVRKDENSETQMAIDMRCANDSQEYEFMVRYTATIAPCPATTFDVISPAKVTTPAGCAPVVRIHSNIVNEGAMI